MHFHAIKRSTDLSEAANPVARYSKLQVDGNDSTTKDHTSRAKFFSEISNGDDAYDLRPWPKDKPLGEMAELEGSNAIKLIRDTTAEIFKEARERSRRSQGLSSSQGSRLTEASIKSLDSEFPFPQLFNEFKTPKSEATVDSGGTNSTHSTSPFLDVAIPTRPTNNLAPFAYHCVLRNRIRDKDLGQGKKYDVKAYTPMFVHDCLMMPGSLANIRGKGSPEDIIRRMTPALLPSFHSHPHPDTGEPLILQSSTPGDFVHGMLVFGQSKHVRRRVHEHYRHSCKRVKVEVELDTLQAVRGRWELRRRTVWAHAWIWRVVSDAASAWDVDRDETRRYDDYLATGVGTARSLSLRIEPARWIEDDRETVCTDEVEDGAEPEGPGWGILQEGSTKSWEEGSDGGAAVAWNGNLDFGASYDVEDEDKADWEYDASAGALDRDYGRNGSAGC